jgi:hypothetical protein
MMHHDKITTINHDQAEDDVQGFLVVAPRDPSNGLPTLESRILEALKQGRPVFPIGPLGGGLPVAVR